MLRVRVPRQGGHHAFRPVLRLERASANGHADMTDRRERAETRRAIAALLRSSPLISGMRDTGMVTIEGKRWRQVRAHERLPCQICDVTIGGGSFCQECFDEVHSRPFTRGQVDRTCIGLAGVGVAILEIVAMRVGA